MNEIQAHKKRIIKVYGIERVRVKIKSIIEKQKLFSSFQVHRKRGDNNCFGSGEGGAVQILDFNQLFWLVGNLIYVLANPKCCFNF